MKTIFIPCRAGGNTKKIVDSIEGIFKGVKKKGEEEGRDIKVGLISTAQFVHLLEEVRRGLLERGIRSETGEGRPNPGQILGCDVRAATRLRGVEFYVYIGTGRFHPLKVAVETGKRVFIVGPEGEVDEISESEVLRHKRIRAARVDGFKRARRIGIIVYTKPGQERMRRALELRRRLEGEKETFIFIANEIKPEYLLGYGIEAWVNTACPRIAEDVFDVPMVDASEIEKWTKNL